MSTTDEKISKELLIIAGSLLLIFCILDYLVLGLGYPEPFENGALLLYKTGPFLRAVFVFCVGFLAYEGFRHKMNPKLDPVKNFAGRIVLVIFTSISVGAFIVNTKFSLQVTAFLYPISFSATILSTIYTIISFTKKGISKKGMEEIGVEKKRQESELGFSLESKGGYVNIPNPFRSIFVVGGAGAGKSASVAEPLILQATRKKYAGFVYDFKFPDLGKVVYSSFQYTKQKGIDLCPVSMTDMQRSLRFNPLDPDLMPSASYADEYARALYSNLDTTSIQRPSFFSDSARNLLKAVIWFMKLEYPRYCTLPHVVNVILNASTDTLVNMISSNDETQGMVKAVKEASEKQAAEQLAGVTGTLCNYLANINDPRTAWVLTGNDFSLDLNDPYDPKMMILGSSPQLREALTPVNAFIMTIALKLMNAQDKHHSLALIDEAPTVYIPRFDEHPATARSNKVCMVYMAQDFSQMDNMFGKNVRNAIVSNLATQFYGNVSGRETADYVSGLFGKTEKEIESRSVNSSSSGSGSSSSSGVSVNVQQRNRLDPNDMYNLEKGEFVGKVVETKKPWFRTTLKINSMTDPKLKYNEIPPFVQDFMLSPEEEKDAKRKVSSSLEKNSLQMDLPEKHLRKAEMLLLDRDEEELFSFYKKILEGRKEERIIQSNFQKLQEEVEGILNKYKVQEEDAEESSNEGERDGSGLL